MDAAFPSPEEVAQAGDSAGTDARVVAVEYSPDRDRAIVFLEYNPDSRPEPYEVLCERSENGWTSSGELGVTTRWDPPRAEWNTPPSL